METVSLKFDLSLGAKHHMRPLVIKAQTAKCLSGDRLKGRLESHPLERILLGPPGMGSFPVCTQEHFLFTCVFSCFLWFLSEEEEGGRGSGGRREVTMMTVDNDMD